MTVAGTGTPLDEQTLRRRERLPLKPDVVTLTGSRVRLRQLDLDRDVAPLFAVSNGEPARLGDREVDAYDAERLIWRYMSRRRSPGRLAAVPGRSCQRALPGGGRSGD
jgi:hypothetical protein